MRSSYLSVEKAFKGLNCNKSWGVDDIYAEHLKYSSKRLYSLLSLCIIWFSVHDILPHSVLPVILEQVVKDKPRDISSKDNYRPIVQRAF